jgi:hypothetical protein
MRFLIRIQIFMKINNFDFQTLNFLICENYCSRSINEKIILPIFKNR